MPNHEAQILVRYGEIALKGANRRVFEDQLQDNIQRALQLDPPQITRHKTEYVLHVPSEGQDLALQRLSRVFGIAWFAPVAPVANDLDAIVALGLQGAKAHLDASKTFAVRARRSDKTLPYKAASIERRLGGEVIEATGASVDLGRPDLTIYIISSQQGSYIFTRRIPGARGLPVGVSGRVLALLSGGFDSIAAAYQLARRGAQLDFLHFHVFPHKQPLLASKIPAIVQALSEYTRSTCLYLSSYLPFESRVLNLHKSAQSYELVLFRRLMARLAQQLAQEHGYQALLFGDSLGQVASQTMENILAVDEAISIPIFRPLIGADKHEVVEFVRTLGLYEAATAPYKDCCSLIAPEPVTKAYLPKVHKLEASLGLDAILAEMYPAVEPLAIADL